LALGPLKDANPPKGVYNMKMEEDIMKKRIEESLGKTIKIILKSNGWKFAGKLVAADEKYIEILDYISGGYKVVDISDINSLDVKE